MPRREFAEKYGLTSEEVTEFLLIINTKARRVALSRSVAARVRDSSDEKVLAAALGGKTDYLLTGDADLLALRDDVSLGQLRIVSVSEFLEVLRGQPEPAG